MNPGAPGNPARHHGRGSPALPAFRDLQGAGAAEVKALVHELYVRVGPMILALGHRYYGARRDIAEDLVAETFARVITGIRRFEGRCAYSTWIFGIALNVAGKWLGRNARDACRPLPPDVAARVDPAGTLEQRSREALVRAALDALSPEHRMVLSLAVIDGLSQVQVADLLGVPTGTVYSRYARARVALARELARRGLGADALAD